MSKYVFFWGGPFSNWAKVEFEYKGVRFSSSEQAMMWEKAMLFKDLVAARMILAVSDPKKQKALGRKIRGYDNEAWDKVRFELVTDILRSKFKADPQMFLDLINTGDKIIVEASPLDTIWGIGLAAGDPLAQDESTWKGLNLLGKALMIVRDEFKQLNGSV